MNFLVVKLVDDDYGRMIKNVLSNHGLHIVKQANGDLVKIKAFIVSQVVAVSMANESFNESTHNINWDSAKNIENYLNRKLHVSLDRKEPIEDEALSYLSGSAYLDINLNMAYFT